MSDDDKIQLESLSRRLSEKLKQSEDANTPLSRPSLTGSRILTEMFSGVLVGAGLGYYLDRWLHTKPLFFIIFVFLGIAAATRNIYKLSSVSNDATHDGDVIAQENIKK